MTKQGFGKLVSLKEAIEIINKISGETDTERINVEQAHTRILAEDIKAPIDVPHFRKSAMDGFAARAEDTFGVSNTTPKKLRMIEHITAGELPTKELKEGECTEITTGACMPEGADCVIMVEYTEKEDKDLKFYKPCAPGDNVIKLGSDIKEGQELFKAGTLINARYSGVLAAMGIQEVKVKRRPVVSLLSTGSELLALDKELQPAKIYDINTATISNAIQESGCELYTLGLVDDDKEKIKEKLLEGIEHSDIILLSGGSSLGTEDMTKEIIEELGVLHVHGIAVKPGKPVIIGEAKGKIILGLPGYPTSALSNYYILVEPVLHKMMGLVKEPEYVKAKLSRKIASTIGRYEFLAVKVKDGVATPVMKGSSSITTLTEANGFLEIDENTEVLNKDDEVQVRRFS